MKNNRQSLHLPQKHVADQKSYNPDQFKQATASVVRALSGDKNANINFYTGPLKNHNIEKSFSQKNIYLPHPPPTDDPYILSQVRGSADANALRLKYHDSKLHEFNQPQENEAKTAFDALEQVRVEALGSRAMLGVAANLRSLQEHKSHVEGHSRMSKIEQMAPHTALALLAREHLTGVAMPKESQPILKLWRNQLSKEGKEALETMRLHLNNQKKYASAARRLLQAYQLIGNVKKEKEDSSDNSKENQPQGNSNLLQPDFDTTFQSPNFSEVDQKEKEEMIDDIENQSELLQNYENTEKSQINRHSSGHNKNETFNTQVEDEYYTIYTKNYDEIVTADQLCSIEELDYLRKQLDQQLYHQQNIISHLANRLQRKLMAKQTRSWSFDLEEGLLDAAKLTRIITNPINTLSYKQEKETDFKDTIVTLLIDNSGSMRGKPINIAAMCGDILARTLERCAVKVEILGFTTRSWKGGKSREQWLNKGKPVHPGRLNDLRHIIYKSADQPWRYAKRNLGLMLQEGLLKENIDGEALYWAWKRLENRYEHRKILMVISDGAPVDDSTLSANTPEYLENHLRRIIHRIEKFNNIELSAIGIGHDVTRYYQRAVTINNVEQLGKTMMQELTSLFEIKRPKLLNSLVKN
ncbi:Aerobic cobaltochelatase subunit CobT [Commensalibacter sp. Nvir]|uniref:cobaltochelatase CobT-related protein n=1 Tax=Commensalibacter sp. Nvir TaxID=3069817 RepID=UPI002D45D456|nr:Aerobic cobaltochelatase subunit CobT [Commensalibacter sp. Nvir]